jgi:Uma2 family endonuclease
MRKESIMPAVPMPIPEAAETPPPRKRCTREEFERLLETGVFAGQRYELIDGDLIDKMGQNPPHAYAIQLLSEWLASFLGMAIVRVRLPMQASGKDSERSLPEPDLAIIRERKPEHAKRHPRGDEMILVIEVSDTTAASDQSRKSALYAAAGVPEYWVLDLNRRMLVVHREPDGVQYRQTLLHPPEESISLPGRSESIRVADILPPA